MKTFLAKVKRKNQVVDFQFIKILLIGSAAAGKTSFCHFLFQSKYSSEYKSKDTKQAMPIVKFTLKQVINKKAILFEQNGLDVLQERGLSSDVTSNITSSYASDSGGDPIILQEDDYDDNNGGDSKLTDGQNKTLTSNQFPKTLVMDKNENVKFIADIDSRGQPEYIHMLPIDKCPTINFVAYEITKNLHDSVIEQYKMHYNDKYRFPYCAPLLVQFSSHFLPFGFFCSFTVHLIQKLPTGWDHQLHKPEHFNNMITSKLLDKLFLHIRVYNKTSCLEIQIHHLENLYILYHSKVFPVLSEYFKEVYSKLNFNHKKIQHGFLCSDSKRNNDQITVVKPFKHPLPSELECCRKCPNLIQLEEAHQFWLKEVSDKNCT